MTFTRPQAGELLGNNNYRVTNKISEGIYHGISLISGKEVVINIESSGNEFYGRLAGGVGIPLVYWSDTNDASKIRIHGSLGPSIGDLFKFCDYKFSANTILLLAGQLISRIEYIHAQSLIHGDLNPDSFCVGRHEFSGQVHVTDVYHDLKTHTHSQSDNERKWTSPAHSATMNTHLLTPAAEKSSRDDIESLGYILLYIYRSSKEHYGRFEQVMMNTPIEDLCRDLPSELATCLNYARSLAFDDEPDYSYLRKIVRDCCIYEGSSPGIVYDWEVRKYQMQSDIVPMSQEQRKSEVRDIYDEFLRAERKCKKSNEQANPEDQPEQEVVKWQTSIKLTQELLKISNQFFLVCGHHSASEDLRQLPLENNMPTRIWGSGIQPCLELLRGHLPASRDHVQSIFSYAYAMVALWYEAGHPFEGTWIKYLGKLAEYRKEIEDDGHDREVWTSVGLHWHSKALGIKTGSENPGPLI